MTKRPGSLVTVACWPAPLRQRGRRTPPFRTPPGVRLSALGLRPVVVTCNTSLPLMTRPRAATFRGRALPTKLLPFAPLCWAELCRKLLRTVADKCPHCGVAELCGTACGIARAGLACAALPRRPWGLGSSARKGWLRRGFCPGEKVFVDAGRALWCGVQGPATGVSAEAAHTDSNVDDRRARMRRHVRCEGRVAGNQTAPRAEIAAALCVAEGGCEKVPLATDCAQDVCRCAASSGLERPLLLESVNGDFCAHLLACPPHTRWAPSQGASERGWRLNPGF